MTHIVKDIQSGLVGIRASCRKYGICRPTLQKWISRLSVRRLGDELSNHLLANMTDDKQRMALENRIKELTRAFEKSILSSDFSHCSPRLERPYYAFIFFDGNITLKGI